MDERLLAGFRTVAKASETDPTQGDLADSPWKFLRDGDDWLNRVELFEAQAAIKSI